VNVHDRSALSAAQRDTIRFRLNGEPVALTDAPDTRLSEALRSSLGATGTKVGCDAGDCGACTVLLDGGQACACLIPIGQVDGRMVTTVEGLAGDPLGHALQASFHAYGAAQCGICTPGMLMAAYDLLSRDRQPSESATLDALGGVLCRCTGYIKIVEAVRGAHGFIGDVTTEAQRALSPLAGESWREGSAAVGQEVAASANPVTRSAPSPTLSRKGGGSITSIGKRIARLDGEPKVAGTEIYGADRVPEGALWLRALRCPHPRARFTLGDLDAFVASCPGLVKIFTPKDVPGENSFGIYPHLKDQPVFSTGETRYRGECVLAIVGEKAAVEAVRLSEFPIVWEPLAPMIGSKAALAGTAFPLHDFAPDNVLTRGRVVSGDVEAGFAAATHTASGDFETGFVEHAYIEPEAGYAQRIGDTIEVFACTQAPYMDRDEVARVLGIPLEDVRIIPSACGGGFGGKLDVSLQPMLAVAAWVLRRPVACVYGRIESMVSSTKRHPSQIAARAACDADGKLVAYAMDGDFDTGAYSSWGPTVAGRVPVHATGPYRVPNVRNLSRAIYTNGPPSGAFRGFGVPQAAIAQESLFDDLAEAAGIDRLEFRLINAIRAGDATPCGQVLEASAGLAECLEALKPHWQALLADACAFNATESRSRRGVGIGCMWYGIGNTGMSNPSTMRITLDAAGALTFWNGAVDIGQGSTTVLTQIAADALGLPVSAFRLVIGDSALTLDAGKTSASRQTFVSGRASEAAGKELRAAILRLTNAGESADLSLDGPSLLVTENGVSSRINLAALPVNSDGIVLEGLGSFDPPTIPLDTEGQGVPYATYGFAAQIASLDVDLDLGTVKLNRIVAAHDVGRAINPMLVEGQIHGGIAQGIGLALMEEYLPGRTENLHDYLIPTAGDVPPIEIILIEDPEPLGPSGAKGIGEPALVPTAPAILGAIRHATGVTPRQIPVLPHRLWELMREKDGEKHRPTPSPTQLGHARVGHLPVLKSATADFSAGEGWGEGSHHAPDLASAETITDEGSPTPHPAAARPPSPLAGEENTALAERSRKFGAAEGEDGIIRCDACPVLCRIRPGRSGACSRYANENGLLVRTDPVVLLAEAIDAAQPLVPFADNAGDWDGSALPANRVFVTGIGSGTTYPDYKPAPFIVSSQHEGVDTVTVVTEGIFSYCGIKVKIDTDRHLGPETAAIRSKGEQIGHVTTAEYGSQMLSLGGVRHLTGGSKKEGNATCEAMLQLANREPVELTIDGGHTVLVQAGQPPIVDGKPEQRMRVGCGSATIGIFAQQWLGHVDEVIVVDDHITGVLTEHQAGRVLDMKPAGIRVRGRKSTPGRYFQVAEPGLGWGGTDITQPLSIIQKIDEKLAWPGMRLLMTSTTGEDSAFFVLDENLTPIETDMPAPVRQVVERIGENCEPSLCTVTFMAGAGGSLRAGVTENPVLLTRSVQSGATRVTMGGAPVHVWPGGGITVMVDVLRLPKNAFGSVPTPALVAPIEFTLPRSLYLALGGHEDEIVPMDEVLRAHRGDARIERAMTENPWPLRAAGGA
jgi:CO/xanthine dehydrogenase Mo-binding subunit/aerobic-type carbon monoxide dehydrogenase small subunit (CoxS/CutS family)